MIFFFNLSIVIHLEQVCSQLGVPEEYHHCFSLYVIRRDPDGDITVVRKLQDFESPYISLKTVSSLKLEDAVGIVLSNVLF